MMRQRNANDGVLPPQKDASPASLERVNRQRDEPSAANDASLAASHATRSSRGRDGVPGSAGCTHRRVRLASSLVIALIYAPSKVLLVWLMHSRTLRTCPEGDGVGRPSAASAKEHLLQNFRQSQRSAGKGARRQGRPTLYLHVGLPKTGTTSLQCSLCRDATATDPILLYDNLVYLGTCPSSDCGVPPRDDRFLHHWPAAFFPRGSTKEPGANPIGPVPHNDTARLRRFLPPGLDRRPLPRPAATLVQRLRDLRDRRMDALIIFEGCHVFSHRHIRALSELLQQEQDWAVRVLVAYRPLYQWLPSKYNSIHKPVRNAAARVWPNQTIEMAVPAAGGRTTTVSVVGAPLLPFALDERGAFSELVRDVEHYGQHPAETVRDNYRQYFDDVRVLPLQWLDQWHQRQKEQAASQTQEDPTDGENAESANNGSVVDPLLEYLFCEALVAPRVCRTVRRGGLGARLPLNPSVALDYDLLAVAAYDSHLFRVRDPRIRRTKRGRVAQMAQRRQEQELGRTSSDFPQQCLPDGVLERLERLSLRLERQLFPENWTIEQEELHHLGFIAHHSKYCWVDTGQVLRDEGWREFFFSLSDTEHSPRQEDRGRAREGEDSEDKGGDDEGRNDEGGDDNNDEEDGDDEDEEDDDENDEEDNNENDATSKGGDDDGDNDVGEENSSE